MADKPSFDQLYQESEQAKPGFQDLLSEVSNNNPDNYSMVGDILNTAYRASSYLPRALIAGPEAAYQALTSDAQYAPTFQKLMDETGLVQQRPIGPIETGVNKILSIPLNVSKGIGNVTYKVTGSPLAATAVS